MGERFANLFFAQVSTVMWINRGCGLKDFQTWGLMWVIVGSRLLVVGSGG